MIPGWVAASLDVVSTLTLFVGLILLARCAKCFSGISHTLLVTLIILALLMVEISFLQWANLLPRVANVEDFLMPLLPTLWLFLFVVELERSDRARLEHGMARMMAVHALASRLAVTMEPSAVMEEVVEAVSRLLKAAYVTVYTPDEQGRVLVVRAHRGLLPEEALSLAITSGEGLAGRAYAEKKPCLSDRPLEDAAVGAQTAVGRAGLRHTIGVPLLFHGEAVGALSLGRSEDVPFDETDVTLLETLSAHTAVAFENARLYEQLAESEARYRLLVENAHVAIVVVDANRIITFWNRGAQSLFGWAAEEVLGRHIGLIYVEEKRDDVNVEILPSLSKGGNWFGEYPLTRKDGSRFTGFMSLARVLDAAGNVAFTLGVMMDVTERLQLREQLIQASKMETIGMMAGGIAHDFNNLLTAILGFAGLLRDSLPPGSEDYDAAVNIEHAGQRGTQLVRQLMSFSQKHPTKTEPVNLNEVGGEACDLIRRTFPRTIELNSSFAADLRLIRGDSTQMHQVIMNLAVNARDAMKSGGSLTVSTANLDLSADDPRAAGLKPVHCVCLTVADTGPGIPPDVQGHIFEPFFTTKHGTGGTGLGLSTVYAIVTRHGGRITLKTEVGHGTTFYVVIPAIHPKSSPAPQADVPQPASTN